MSLFDSLARANPGYVAEQFERYRRDPKSVDPEWRLVFAGYEFAAESGAATDDAERAVGVLDLVHSYRELGHLVADLDPLGHNQKSHPLLELEEFGLGDADLDRVYPTGNFRGLDRAPVRELLRALRETYCGTIAVEYLDIDNKEQRDWIQQHIEPSRNKAELSAEDKKRLLARLIAAEGFEQFLHTKYVGQKRFSLEGGEALIPMLDAIVDDSVKLSAEEMVMGMPHRGRLNVLAHTLRKPYEMILSEFEGTFLPANIQGDGDVKYHLGYSHDRRIGDRKIHLSLSPNPSHLEIINPIVEGIVRAKQAYLGDPERRRVVPVLLHGDAAFTGQGSVYETIQFSALAGFTTGGTIHIIVNNQVGFTTSPSEERFTRYPTDIALMVQSPVFHVNGDDPEAAVQAARLAMAFRQRFHVDVFIELVCYRRHGHNEIDDPSFTQPVMYREIAEHPTITPLYAKRLEKEGVVTAEEVTAMRAELKSTLEDALGYARDFMPRQQVFALGGVWKGFTWAGDDWSADTTVPADRLRELAQALRRLPEGFTPHKRLDKLLHDRAQMVASGNGIDWGCAETLAYATLLAEGTPVRLCGQDTGRGTFSHRHAILHDAVNGQIHVPLNHVAAEQAKVEIINSNLSEAGVLGFEYGMASADPHRLVIWEAQFGDFANGAQVIIDQFISSSESKWQRMSGITLLLPHGYEGQGPEHSSARLERYLQLCAERNMQVVNCTTPAQIFHALRRQVHRNFRKPLVVMSPKSLLRHPRVVSTLAELAEGTFQLVLDDPSGVAPASVQRLILCSGKIFYALEKARDERDGPEVALVRLEQLYPFPAKELSAIVARYANAEDVTWAQDEPANQGAWSFVRPLLLPLLRPDQTLRYIGRDEAASPATGSYKIHQAEENAILDEAFKRTRGLRAASADEPRATGERATG